MWKFIFAVLLTIAARPAAAATSITDLNESGLNNFAAAVGPQSGNLGQFEYHQSHPCFPDVWNQCDTVLYSGGLPWTLSAPIFHITPGSIVAETTVRASLAGLTFVKTVYVNTRITRSGSELVVSVDSVSIPITFGVSGGQWTPATLTVPLDRTYRIAVPTGFSLVAVETPRGTGKLVHVATQNLNFVAGQGAVRIIAEHTIW